MKKITRLGISLLLFIGFSTVQAQDKNYGAEPQKCKENLSLFFSYAKAKNYDAAYEPWTWCIENCPASSLNLYYYGLKIAEHRYNNGDKEAADKLIDKLYEMRIKYFPQNLGKVYSDWAISLDKRGKSKDLIFEKLEAGFKENPADLSVRNMAKYFDAVTERNKDTDVQKIFDTYDDVMEAVNIKIDGYTQELDKINKKEAEGAELTAKEKRTQHNNGINLKALGQVESVLDQILGEVATCERLIPLYQKGFEEHKTDAKWLRRAASRLNDKECTDDALYPTLVEALVTADPSSNSYIFYAGILEKRGESAKALEYQKKAVDIETDPYKKAGLLYKIASTLRNPSAKRAYLRKAIEVRPSFGRAYLAIANLYYHSAENCGNDEFSKRMVYVAALNMAQKAKSVDPSISSLATKYIKNYSTIIPSQKLIFQLGKKSGETYKIGCWIGETVKIP
ncbi:hypothetical protein MWU59_01655 [Flavobacteriaceae bacterium F08102]|nr:hypothetical protein [Flavobacteriaceae bacterium F08102]